VNQEVRVKLDISLEFPISLSTKDLEGRIVDLVRGLAPNHHNPFNELAYAEERNIYLKNEIKWKSLTKEVRGDKEES
jgi:hypothetical protein